MTLFDRNKICNLTKAFHLDSTEISITSQWRDDWKQEFLNMEQQLSVGPDRPVKEDHLWRWTTFPPKISTWTEEFHFCLDRNFQKIFGIMESNPAISMLWENNREVHTSCFVMVALACSQSRLNSCSSIHCSNWTRLFSQSSSNSNFSDSRLAS